MHNNLLRPITILLGLLLYINTHSLAQKPVLTARLGHSVGSTVSFSPDETKILTYAGNSIKLWDVESGRLIRTFNFIGSPKGASFSPDGNKIISISHNSPNKKEVVYRDMKTGKILRSEMIDVSGPSSAVFSPGHNFFLVPEFENITLWDTEKLNKIHTFQGHKDIVRNATFNSDASLVLSFEYDRKMILWNVKTGKKIQTFKHSDYLTDAAISSDGSKILSRGSNETLILWEVKGARKIREFKEQVGFVFTFSPDGTKVIRSDREGNLILWDLKGGKDKILNTPHSTTINSLDFSKDGKTVLSSSIDGSIKLWDYERREELKSFGGNIGSISDVAIDSHGSKMLFSLEGKVVLTDLNSAKINKLFEGHKGIVTTVAFSPDGSKILSGSTDKTLIYWDINTRKKLRVLEGHTGRINAVKFLPDGTRAISGSEDGTMKLWNQDSGSEINSFTHGENIKEVDVNFSGEQALSIGGNIVGKRTVKLWNLITGRELSTFKNKGFKNNAIFNPDGTGIALFKNDGFVLLDLESESIVQAFKGSDIHDEALSIDKNGFKIISGSVGGYITILNVETGQIENKFQAHQNTITSINISPEGDWFLTSSKDGSLKFWHIPSGNLLATYYGFKNSIDWIATTPDGRFDGTERGMELLYYVKGTNIIPLESLFEQYYTPNLLPRVLEGGQFSDPVVKIDEISLPPRVGIASPSPSALPIGISKSSGRLISEKENITVKVRAIDQGGGVDEIRLYHNGKLVDTSQRGLKLAKSGDGIIERSFDIALLDGKNRILATAFNDQRTEAKPVEIVIYYEGIKTIADLYVLAVGINKYKNTSLNLNYGRPDAEAFVTAVENQSAGIFKSIKVTALHDENATQASVKSAFDEIIARAQPQDAFLFFYAGHGVMSEPEGGDPGDFYMALHEATRLYGDNAGLKAHGISASEMTELTRRIAARKQMIVLDACQSGGAVQTFAMRGAAEQKAILQLARSAGLVVIASTGTEQYATEFQALGHGVFTYALLQGLGGQADGGSRDRKITVKELEAFINDRVPALTQKHRGQTQYPNSYARGQDFPISIVNN